MKIENYFVPRRDYASLKSHKYKTSRRLIKKEKLKKEVIKRRFRIALAIISIISLLASIFYWIFFSPLLLINKIEISDEKGEAHLQIADLAWHRLQNKIWHFLPQSNYLLFKTDSLLKELENSADLILIKKITVQKVWPHKLLITFSKRIPKVKLITVSEEKRIIYDEDINEAKEEVIISKRSYLVDEEAVVLDEDTISDLEPVVEVAVNNIDFKPGERIIEQKAISQILNLYDFFKDAGLPIAYFQLNSDNANSIKAYIIRQNYYLYLSLDHSLQKQINNLLLTLERIGEAEAGKLQYIDLRIEERAYACCDLKIEE